MESLHNSIPIDFTTGPQWEKIPRTGSNQEINRQKERSTEQPLEEREDEDRKKIEDDQATEIEWLGFQKSHQIDIIRSKHDEEQEVWDEENDNGDDDDDDGDEEEDIVREIEFKKKNEASSHFTVVDANENSPLSLRSPSVTPDEQPIFGKKSDIPRNSYSRYNTISYRKIRKGNTKQRIDEFESMMNL